MTGRSASRSSTPSRPGGDGRRLVKVGPARRDEAFALLRHLRPTLTPADLADALRRGSRAHRLGYRLFGVEIDERLVALAGARPLVTLARGRHLHIDDLVVDPAWRRRGVGRFLLEEIEKRARRQGLGAIHLDSFLEAVPFYEALGFGTMSCRAVVKRLSPAVEGDPGKASV